MFSIRIIKITKGTLWLIIYTHFTINATRKDIIKGNPKFFLY